MGLPRPTALILMLAMAALAAGPSAEASGPRGKAGIRASRVRNVGRVVPDDELRKEPVPRPSGNIHVMNVNLHEELKINIFNPDGSYSVEAMEELSRLLRCKRTDEQRPMEPRLFSILSTVYDHYGGRRVDVVSGFRNQRRTSSYHFKGSATDIRVPGVSPRKLRAYVQSLDTGGMGIGIYPRTGFVHVDIRPLPSYRWIDHSRSNPNSADKRPPRGWKRKKLQS